MHIRKRNRMEKIFNPERLNVAMGRRRKSMRDMAFALDVTTPIIRKFFTGQVPSSEQVERMARFLNWPIGWFYKESDHPWETEVWVSGHIYQNPLIPD